jgi:hypothetical protein
VIGRLLRLVLEVALDSGNIFFIGIIGVLVVVTLVAASSNSDSLGVLLWPPLVVFGALLHGFSNYLLTRGVPGGDVEKLLCGLRLITTRMPR